MSTLARPVLVTGGRFYADAARVAEALAAEAPTLVIHGGCRGADILADAWARAAGIHVARVDALWDIEPKRAGPIRNGVLVELAAKLGAIVVAFPGGSGTVDCVRKARAAGLEVREVR